MIRGWVKRTRDLDGTYWTAEVNTDAGELMFTVDQPMTEAGRLKALNIANLLVRDYRAVETIVDRLADVEQELHFERTGECQSCRGTGVIDSAEHRCGACRGRGYIEPPIVAEHRKMQGTIERVKRWARANEDPSPSLVIGLLLYLEQSHPGPQPVVAAANDEGDPLDF